MLYTLDVCKKKKQHQIRKREDEVRQIGNLNLNFSERLVGAAAVKKFSKVGNRLYNDQHPLHF